MSTAFVIGAGPGIATGVAQLFASRGYAIGLTARSQSTLDTGKAALKSHGVKVATSAADTGDIKALVSALESLKKEVGAPSVILYNVSALGLALRQTPLLELEPDDLDTYFSVGVRGALVCSQWAAKNLQPGEDGKKSLFYTGGGLARQPRPGFEGLSMDKAALLSLTKAMAYTLDKDGTHAAIVNVHGHVKDGDKKYSKELIAKEFGKLHDESSGHWTHEVDY